MVRLKALVQYLVILCITGFLLWIALRKLISSEDGEDVIGLLLSTWSESDKFYMLLMAIVAMASHALRALRWKMLLDISQHPSTFLRAFYSLMIGYLVNMAIPRGGELSRCYNLYKMDRTPIEISLGSVVAERTIDFLCMMLVFILTFIFEWQPITKLVSQFMAENNVGSALGMEWLFVALAVILIIISLIYFLSKSEKFKSSVKKFWVGFKTGLLSVFALKRKGVFIYYTVSIWLLYFLMTKLVLMAFPETALLSWAAVLVIFSVGILAMAIPLPGGAGSYHVLLPLALIGLYTIPESRAIAFTFIFHAWQSFILVLAGAISLIASFIIIKWQAKKKY
jgi:glycosyltransferase 2 family protein